MPGHYDVRHGMIIVTASDGRTKSAALDETVLNTETLAKSLLLPLNNEKG